MYFDNFDFDSTEQRGLDKRTSLVSLVHSSLSISSLNGAFSDGFPVKDSGSMQNETFTVTASTNTLSRRASLGISMEDIMELTAETSSISAPGSEFGFKSMSLGKDKDAQKTMRAWRRTSLDLLFSTVNHGHMAGKEEGLGESSEAAWASSILDDDVARNHNEYESCQDDTTDLPRRSCSLSSASTAASASSFIANHTISSSIITTGLSPASDAAASSKLPPFDPSSPYYSSKFVANYQTYLKCLLECMDDSQRTRKRVDSIKKTLKKHNTSFKSLLAKNLVSMGSMENLSSSTGALIDVQKKTKGMSYSAIKKARRKKKRQQLQRKHHQQDGDYPIGVSSSASVSCPAATTSFQKEISTKCTPQYQDFLIHEQPRCQSTSFNAEINHFESAIPTEFLDSSHAAMRVSRRRSSVGVQAFKNKFFPDFM